jgi:hypothetical protein
MINVNQVVLAKLTKRGAFMVNEQNRELMFRFPQQKLRADYRPDDLYEQYMWVLMKHFGSEFHMGKEAPLLISTPQIVSIPVSRNQFLHQKRLPIKSES